MEGRKACSLLCGRFVAFLFCSQLSILLDLLLLFFTSRYFADVARSLNMCCLFLSQNALQSILASIISHKKQFLNMCLGHQCFCRQTVFNMLLFLFTFSQTYAFFTSSFQLIFSILFQIQISKAPLTLFVCFCQSPSPYCTQCHIPDKTDNSFP